MGKFLCAPLCNPWHAFVVSFYHEGTQSTHEGTRSMKECLNINIRLIIIILIKCETLVKL